MAIVTIAVISFSFVHQDISKVLQGKIDSSIRETYTVADFSLQQIDTPASISKRVKNSTSIHIFRIKEKNSLLGYIYLGRASSKKELFDYIVMFNTDLTIKKAKVLIYREDYGRQIGSQRWLRQFIGLSPSDRIVYGKNVDAISGATISASSMSTAIGDVLNTMGQLKNNKSL